MTPKPQEKPYFLLSKTISAEPHLHHLLGLTVEDPYAPLTATHPRLPPSGLDISGMNETVKTSYSNYIPGHDVHYLKNQAYGADAKARVTDALNLFAALNKAEDQSLTAPGYRRFELYNHQDVFRDLMRDDTYAQDVINALRALDGAPLYLITSVLTFANMHVEKGNLKEKGAGAQLAVPIDGPAGGSTNQTVGASAALTSTSQARIEGTYEGEMVVALGYAQVTLSEPVGLFGYLKSHFEKKPPTEIKSNLLKPKEHILIKREAAVGNFPTPLGEISDEGPEKTAQNKEDQHPFMLYVPT